MECESLSDPQLIELIAEDTTYLKCVSLRTRDYCLNFMRRMSSSIDPEMLKDIYHDALIVLYEKARTGEFRLTCSLQTYLNSVCRNQLLNTLRDNSRTSPLAEGYSRDSGDENEQYADTITDWLHAGDIGINNERVQAILQSLEHMKGKGDCHELLLLVHYQGKSMKDVAAHFGYKNEQIARNKNYLCREQLKALTFRLLKKLKQ
ncbi:MAG: sigma-70 family polymerase sigma factor [Flavipsychrobacter sp.]|nr:sigma-70 family polymerase sigma factor [Flavipsychrobacter sp.]